MNDKKQEQQKHNKPSTHLLVYRVDLGQGIGIT